MASPTSQGLEEEDLQSIYAARSRSITQPRPRNSSQGRRPPRTSGLGRVIDDESRLKRAFSAPGLADDDPNHALPQIRIGICAMDKKARSKPMRAILDRLISFGEFDIVNFGDDMIVNRPVDQWPRCDCLLSWNSEGFPLSKAQKYAALRKPYLINDMSMQDILLDRRRVYRKLMESGIPVPTHIIIDRDGLAPNENPEGFVETEDYVEFKGVKIKKPFVEKPADGDDHNIYIYYPHSMGGGVKKLYRKVENKSGDYDPKHPGNVRRDGSYIVEEFLTTGGTDVKVYTVGPRYAHAEARKSPVVDGKVVRSADGKELRFPVLLSPQEKEVARMVCLAFGQKVCGFDLLRSERGKSFVCDVNGWSFVKNSVKYYDDAAGILRSIILSAIAPHRLTLPPGPPGASFATPPPGHPAGLAQWSTSPEQMLEDAANDHFEDDRPHEELRCVLAVIRHGDRTPKQKMKMKINQEPMLELLMKHLDAKGKQAKLKSPQELQDLLDITRQLLADMDRQQRARSQQGKPASGSDGKASPADQEFDEVREKFRIVKTVLEQGGHFAGVNRKVQLKPMRWEAGAQPGSKGARITEALLILKHGGVLTHAGRQQAEALGNVFRMVMYPQFGPAGGGLLRLHSTYRHDLKIYSSDEGRVQTSAAAFTQGLLDLEGTSLTPILVSLVKKDAGMLDAFGKGASDEIREAKDELYRQMTWDPSSNTSMYTEPQSTTPRASPPPSPKPGRALQPDAAGTPPQSPHVALPSSGRPASTLPTSALAEHLASHASSQAAAQATSQSSSSSQTDRPVIHPLPDNPLAQLHRLVDLITTLIGQLKQKLREAPEDDAPQRNYSALTQSPREWAVEEGQPCCNEKLLLMFDRWRKLLKAFFDAKKKVFDISKVPDIYDSAKYDAIHNSELGLNVESLYLTAKSLADAVIPNEYGISPEAKLCIGSKICCNLLGKLLADLHNMREESIATAGMEGAPEPVSPFDSYAYSTPEPRIPKTRPIATQPGSVASTAKPAASSLSTIASSTAGEDVARLADIPRSPPHSEGELSGQGSANGPSTPGVQGGEQPEAEGSQEETDDTETLHRLCPTYAQDINSPLRHVRTRIYFTSESHVHSLINVLRSCHLGNDDEPLLGDEARRMLQATTELDYMTHIVFRMYENMQVPVDSPDRFRMELLFSPGASHDPYSVVPLKQDHTLPISSRSHLHEGMGVTLQHLEKLLRPHSRRYTVPGCEPVENEPPAGMDSLPVPE